MSNSKKQCHVCGIDFHRYGRSRSILGVYFCTQGCVRQYYKGRNHPNKKPHIAKICEYCKKSFLVEPNLKSRKYCNQSCYGRSMERSLLGVPKVYSLKRWKKLRVKVLVRDQNTCVDCGIESNCLDVHHKVPYRLSRSNQLSNLIALCRSCHLKRDKILRLSESI